MTPLPARIRQALRRVQHLPDPAVALLFSRSADEETLVLGYLTERGYRLVAVTADPSSALDVVRSGSAVVVVSAFAEGGAFYSRMCTLAGGRFESATAPAPPGSRYRRIQPVERRPQRTRW